MVHFWGYTISPSITANLVWRWIGDFEGWRLGGGWVVVGHGVWGSGRRLHPRRRKGGAGGMAATGGGWCETGLLGKWVKRGKARV